MGKFKFVNLFLRKSHDLVMGFDKSFDPIFKEPQRYMRRRKPISEGNFLTMKKIEQNFWQNAISLHFL